MRKNRVPSGGVHNVLFKNQHFVAIPSFCFRGPWFGIPVLLTIATKFYYVHIFPVTCRSEDSIVCLAKGSAFWQIMGQHNRIRLQNSNWVFMIWGHSITTWTRWGGGGGAKNVCFFPRSGDKNCPRQGGGGGKKRQNSVHVVVECTLVSKRLLF